MRQRIRKTILVISFLLFPVTIWYFSPYLIIQAASEHIMNGSFIVFCAMFVFSMFFGRAWCGYLCPAGGLQECLFACNPNPAKQGKRDGIKYVIWVIWIIAVIVIFLLGKNQVTINPFYMTDHGISIAGIHNYVVYYGVILLFVLPALIHGRRASCHYVCWMAPFMVIGSTIGRLLHIPQLHVEADSERCISCGQCSKACPMGLDVKNMVLKSGNSGHSERMQSGSYKDGYSGPGNRLKTSECIQCGACIDACPKKVLKYKCEGLKWKI